MSYSLIVMVSVIIHLIINHEFFSNQEEKTEANKAFKRYVWAALGYYLTDVAWGIINDFHSTTWLYLNTIFYYITMALTVLLLCRYVTTYLKLESGFGKFINNFGFAFGIFELLLLLVNHFVHIFFWIDGDGVYHAYIMRHVALCIQVLLCVLLEIQTASVIGTATGARRKRYFTVFLFCMWMTIAIIVQLMYPMQPLYSIGLVVGIVIIHTFVKESEKEEQYQVLRSIADIHYSMHTIDLVNDTVTEINAQNEVKQVVNRTKGAAKMMEDIMRTITTEEYLEKALAFTDLSTLAQRMQNKQTLSIQLMGKRNGWFLLMFISSESDSDGKPVKVICTTRIIDVEKKHEEELIFHAQIDELTGLYNRRAYEYDLLHHSEAPAAPDFVYAEIDVNGLKAVNDKLGHAAGDELIRGAADCLKKAFSHYGRIYRTGGDEFVCMFFADETQLNSIIKKLDETMLSWSGTLVPNLSLSVGYVSGQEFPGKTAVHMAKIADQRMYQAKAAYYSRKGFDRRGQADAHIALCNLYTKILKINITDDTYSIINMNVSEQTNAKGFADTISSWLHGFGASGQVHPDDLAHYFEKTDLEYLKRYFHSGKTSISIAYRRKYADGFKQVAMEMIPAGDYSEGHQTLFLYVKSIEL